MEDGRIMTKKDEEKGLDLGKTAADPEDVEFMLEDEDEDDKGIMNTNYRKLPWYWKLLFHLIRFLSMINLKIVAKIKRMENGEDHDPEDFQFKSQQQKDEYEQTMGEIEEILKERKDET